MRAINKIDELTAEQMDEAAERRLAEMELIQAAYSPEEAYVSDEGANGGCCSIVRRLRLPVACTSSNGVGVSDADDAAVEVDLSLEMPAAYPIREDGILRIKGSLRASPPNPAFIRKAALNAIPRLVEACRQTASEMAESHGGGEAAWSVLSRADEWADSEWENILEEHGRNALANAKSSSARPAEEIRGADELGRRIIFSHHIIANSKRRALADLASQCKLGGYAKIGWPGVILVEGSESDCRAFVDEVKRWRWQQIQVRGEERVAIPEGESLDSRRRLPTRFEEIGEDGMSLLASNCREAGLESLFLTCMKINDRRTADEEGHSDGESDAGSNHGVLVHVDHMNDGKKYRKWLQKTCQAQGCTLLVRRCHLDADANRDRPTIYVGIFGSQHCVKQVMKLWRTSRVDVDSKNKPCLERMMTVVEQGDIRRIPNNSSSSNDKNDLDCSFENFESLVAAIDSGWAQRLKNRPIFPK